MQGWNPLASKLWSRRPYSIKTRIKTLNQRQWEHLQGFSRRPYSIKTRIKTSATMLTNMFMPRPLADHIPLKQGLRPECDLCSNRCLRIARRPYSIKTRIKTFQGFLALIHCLARRPYSIKTRIKTLQSEMNITMSCALADHIPLKQGLRLIFSVGIVRGSELADHIPLKQGLRHIYPAEPLRSQELADHIPLKQGLRLRKFSHHH